MSLILPKNERIFGRIRDFIIFGQFDQVFQIAQLLVHFIFVSFSSVRENMRKLKENSKHKIPSIEGTHKPVHCKECNKNFFSSTSYRRHQKTIHIDQSIKVIYYGALTTILVNIFFFISTFSNNDGLVWFRSRYVFWRKF